MFVQRCLFYIRHAFAALAVCYLAACEQRETSAIVISKEHIAAAASPAPRDASSPTEPRREMPDDEISVDGYVMRADVRGTSRDPRATEHEQWRIVVRTTDDGRTLTIRGDRAQFEHVNEGDHVRVRYRLGRYTGTAWTADLVDR